MKFAVAPEQKSFFEHNHYIEIEGLLNLSQLELIKAQRNSTSKRDIWRNNTEIKKIITSRALGELLFEFTDVKPIRLAYDEYLSTNQADATLEQIGSIQGVIGGIIFNLEEPGNALIVSSDYPVPFHTLKSHYLVAYCQKNSVYVLRTNDPHTHALKQLGYSHGDRLNDKQHPIIFR